MGNYFQSSLESELRRETDEKKRLQNSVTSLERDNTELRVSATVLLFLQYALTCFKTKTRCVWEIEEFSVCLMLNRKLDFES